MRIWGVPDPVYSELPGEASLATVSQTVGGQLTLTATARSSNKDIIINWLQAQRLKPLKRWSRLAQSC